MDNLIDSSDFFDAFEAAIKRKEKNKDNFKIIDIKFRNKRFVIKLIDQCPTFLVTEWHMKEGNWTREFGYYCYNSAIAIETLFSLVQNSKEENIEAKM